MKTPAVKACQIASKCDPFSRPNYCKRIYSQSGPLRDLHPGLNRPRVGSRVQLAGCPIRCCLGLYKESGPCRLGPDPIALRRRVDIPVGLRIAPTCRDCWMISAPVTGRDRALAWQAFQAGEVITRRRFITPSFRSRCLRKPSASPKSAKP
jgi:hypothetical protein